MLKLWHKYALALFSASLIPLGVAGWQIAGSGAEEVTEGAYKLHTTLGALGVRGVGEYVNSAVIEAKAVMATFALAEVSVEDRLVLAQAQLIAASRLGMMIVYSPKGELAQHMHGQGADGKDLAPSIEPPDQLPEALYVQSNSTGRAFGQIVTTATGERYLPIIVRVRKTNGEVYAYGWTVLDLAPLNSLVAESSMRYLGDPDNVTVIDGSITIVAHNNPARIGQELSKDTIQLGAGGGKIFKLDQTIRFQYTSSTGEPRIGALTSIPELGWGVLVEQPRAEVMVGVDRIWSVTFLVGGAFAAIALLLGIFAGRRFSAPIVALSKAAGTVAKGDFSARVAVKSRDEVGQLGNAFNSMAGQLSTTVEQLKEVTATRERMQTELDIGRKIQMSMVPLNFPAFPERPEFDIHAALHPAFEVGGDFYDFFLIDATHLCVIVADVSGKGVPAALFMAVTRTLVKAHAHGGATSDEIVVRVNDDLAMDNEACMFVTVFLGILEIQTGRMAYTNAGHNPSYVKRLSGKVERLDKLHGPVVAAMEEIPYGHAETTLAPGEAIFMYTDGVNEAMNAKEELFTEERLAKLLENDKFTSSKATVKVVLDDVWKFQGDADQSDDVTVVALRYLGPAKGA